MNNKLLDVVGDVDNKDLLEFIKNTKSDLTGKVEVKKIVSDSSWMDLIEEAIPYLDAIIRNPRRFIVQEETVVPIEKAKVVTEETVKHLAQHTDFIQSVDEDGTINPSKLLNVYREETFDLYENRFIKTLVDQLYIFVDNKLKESDQKSYVKSKSYATYYGETKIGDENLKVDIKIEGNRHEILSNADEILKREKQIQHIREIISAFQSSTFIKSLNGCERVRSPIRKTNTILKDQNFKKALGLWEYLEANLLKPMTETVYEVNELTNDNKNYFDVAYYISKNGIEERKVETSGFNSYQIARVLNDAVFDANLSTKKVEKMIQKELEAVVNEKIRQETEVDSFFKEQIALFSSKKRQAISNLR